MSISAGGYGVGRSLGWFSWFARLFSSRKDERSPAIIRTLHTIAKVLEEIDITRKRMESRYSDLAKKAKDAALKGDKDHHKILLVEMDEVSKLIALMVHAKKSIYQIKLRLETMLEMGNTFDQLPEVMETISSLKPLLAKVTPDLMEKMAELEKQVSSIMATTTLPPVYGKVVPKKTANGSPEELKELLPPQENERLEKEAVAVGYAPGGSTIYSNNVDLETIKKWLLDEIRITNGFIDLDMFSKKYGVDRSKVIKALNSLYEEGKIVFRKGGA